MKIKAARFITKQRKILFAIFSVFLALGLLVFSQSVKSWKQKQVLENQHCCGNPQTATGEFISGETVAYFLNEPISPLSSELAQIKPEEMAVLGTTSDNKWIDIDLTSQTVRAMEGDKEIYKFLISSGKWAPTPTGDFAIWSKFKYAKMSGGSKELHTYYYLPNVPFTMYFTSTGVGLHGAYWHNNFGHPMSHGCVNMAIPDAEKIFYWSNPQLPLGKSAVRATVDNPGTRVIVRGTAPKS